MIRKLIAATAVFVGTLIIGGAVAQAAPYPAPAPPISASATDVVPGGTITISGTGFIPGETVSFSIDYTPLGSGLRGPGFLAVAAAETVTTVADATGSWTVTLRLDQIGIATITATGLTSGKVSTTVVTVGGPGFEGGPTTTAPSTPVAVPSTPGVNPTGGVTTTPVPLPPGGDSASGGGLSNTGVGINVAAMIAIGAGIVLAGFALAVFGARGAFGGRSRTLSHS